MPRRRKHIGSEVRAFRRSRTLEYHRALDVQDPEARWFHLDRAIAFQAAALSASGPKSERMGGWVENAAPSESNQVDYEEKDREYAALGDIATGATLDEAALAAEWADMFPPSAAV